MSAVSNQLVHRFGLTFDVAAATFGRPSTVRLFSARGVIFRQVRKPLRFDVAISVSTNGRSRGTRKLQLGDADPTHSSPSECFLCDAVGGCLKIGRSDRLVTIALCRSSRSSSARCKSTECLDGVSAPSDIIFFRLYHRPDSMSSDLTGSCCPGPLFCLMLCLAYLEEQHGSASNFRAPGIYRERADFCSDIGRI